MYAIYKNSLIISKSDKLYVYIVINFLFITRWSNLKWQSL